jgi:prevent-host-death family protein
VKNSNEPQDASQCSSLARDQARPGSRRAAFGYDGFVKSVPATEVETRLGAILDEAQRETIVICRKDRDVAMVISMEEYERLRAGKVQAFLDLRTEIAAEAASRGLTEARIADLLSGDDA